MVSWLFSRAAHWVLDRNGVRGRIGTVELCYGEEDEAEEEPVDRQSSAESTEQRVIDARPLPDRSIYALDFRAGRTAQEFTREINGSWNPNRPRGNRRTHRQRTGHPTERPRRTIGRTESIRPAVHRRSHSI